MTKRKRKKKPAKKAAKKTVDKITVRELSSRDGVGLCDWLSITIPRGAKQVFLREVGCGRGHRAVEVALSPSVLAALDAYREVGKTGSGCCE